MIRKGDRLENPVTGEVLMFHRTSGETGGDAVLVETIVRAGGLVAAAHVHAYQTERFEVLERQLGLRVGDRELLAGPGDVATVERGTPIASGTPARTRPAFSARCAPSSSSSP